MQEDSHAAALLRGTTSRNTSTEDQAAGRDTETWAPSRAVGAVPTSHPSWVFVISVLFSEIGRTRPARRNLLRQACGTITCDSSCHYWPQIKVNFICPRPQGLQRFKRLRSALNSAAGRDRSTVKMFNSSHIPACFVLSSGIKAPFCSGEEEEKPCLRISIQELLF